MTTPIQCFQPTVLYSNIRRNLMRLLHRNSIKQVSFYTKHIRFRTSMEIQFQFIRSSAGAFYHDRRTQLQRISVQLNKSKYQPKSSSVIPDRPNEAAASNNPVDLKYHKIAKYRNRYKSRCRCERITNCPQIQIAVSRCPSNYFLCCF